MDDLPSQSGEQDIQYLDGENFALLPRADQRRSSVASDNFFARLIYYSGVQNKHFPL